MKISSSFIENLVCTAVVSEEELSFAWISYSFCTFFNLPLDIETRDEKRNEKLEFLKLSTHLVKLESMAFHSNELISEIESCRKKIEQWVRILFEPHIHLYNLFISQRPILRIFIGLVVSQLEWIQEIELLSVATLERSRLISESPIFSFPQLGNFNFK